MRDNFPAPPPTFHRLGKNDRIVLEGISYTVQSSNRERQVLRGEVDPGMVSMFTHAQWAELSKSPGFRLDPDYFDPIVAGNRMAVGSDFLSDIPAVDVALMSFNEHCVLTLMAAHARGEIKFTSESLDKNRKAVSALIREGWEEKRSSMGKRFESFKVPGRTRLLELKREFLKRGFPSMRDGRYKNGSSLRLDPRVAAAMAVEVGKYASPEKPSKSRIVTNVIDRIDEMNEKIAGRNDQAVRAGSGIIEPMLRAPDRKTVLKAIKDLDPFLVLCGRAGVDAAVKLMPAVRGAAEALAPLDRVEFDETEVDLMTLAVESSIWEYLTEDERAKVKRMRMWLSVAIDVATRCIVGMRLSPKVNGDSVLRTIEMTLGDKGHYIGVDNKHFSWHQHGRPRLIVMDQGSGNISDKVRTACADSGIQLSYAPAGDPAKRGTGERFFRSLTNFLYEMLDGRTFSNVVMRADYDSEGRASLTTDELCWLFVIAVVGIYHNTPHRGLNGRTPNEQWALLSKDYGVYPPPDRNRKRVAFGLRRVRKATANGLALFGLSYANEQIDHHYLHGHGRLETSADLSDISVISVKVNGVWYEANCREPGLERVGVEEWLAVCEAQHAISDDDAKKRSAARRAAKKIIASVQDRARRRSSIGHKPMTAKDLDLAEKRIFGKYAHAVEDMPTDNGSLGTPVGTPTMAPVPPSAPATAEATSKARKSKGRRNGWGIGA